MDTKLRRRQFLQSASAMGLGVSLAGTAGLNVAREGERGPEDTGEAKDCDGKKHLHSLELRIARRCGFVQDIWGRGNCTMVAGYEFGTAFPI